MIWRLLSVSHRLLRAASSSLIVRYTWLKGVHTTRGYPPIRAYARICVYPQCERPFNDRRRQLLPLVRGTVYLITSPQHHLYESSEHV